MDTPLPSVAFFMHDLSGGGVERMRLRLAAALAGRGHAVTLIVQSHRGALRSAVPASIELVDLATPRTWAAVGPLIAVLRERRPDILVSSLDHNNIAALCARIIVGGGTRVVICQHNALSVEATTDWRYRLVPVLYRVLARWADDIVAVSQGVANDLAASAGLHRSRINVIYNPVLNEPECEDTSTAPHPWLTNQSVPTFLFVGRLVPQKDPLLLLRAFALRLQVGNARLIILGEGPLAYSLQQECFNLGISDAVHFAGFVQRPGLWMEHAAALVLPSRYEGFGNVIVEALAHGTPVIATDCPYGPSEILAGGRFGWLVPVGDKARLAAAMADDPRGSFPKYKLKRRARDFSIDASTNRHQMLFDRIERRRARPVFGLTFSRLTATQISKHIVSHAPAGVVRSVVSQNLDMLRLMREQPAFAEASRTASIVCADGFPVAIYARLRGAASGPRVTGCDVFHAFAATAADHRKKTLVVAESGRTAGKLREWARARDLFGLWDAVVAPEKLLDDPEAQIALAIRIAEHAPDILVMTLGAPTSEIFLHRYRAILPPCWALCCGQAVRVELGLARRAPPIIERINMEWAWRLAHEPRRLAPRYFRDALAVGPLLLADFKEATMQRQKLSGPLGDQAGT